MEHSVYGASSMYKTEVCAGHNRMTKLFRAMYPELADKANPPAELGTAAHHLSEFCLQMGVETYDCVGMTFNKHLVTDEMAAYVNVYVGEIRKILAENPDAVLMVEKRVVMSSVGNDVFGTGDCIIYIPSKRKVYNIDLKYGYGIVDVYDNIQLAFYSVATLDTYQWWGLVDTVEAIIIQPRAEHIDGVIRRHIFTRDDLVQWQKKFADIVAVARRNDAPLVAGEHCKYCDASPICRARLQRTMSIVGHDAPLETLSTAEVIAFYKEIKVMTMQFEKMKDLAIQLGKSGANLGNDYKMVKAIQRHVCADDKAFIDDVLNHPDCKINGDELFNQKLKGKTDLMKIKGVPKSVIDKHFKAPPTALTLVPITDKRPAYGIGGGLNRFNNVD